MDWNKSDQACERGYFGSISSGRHFQFFSAHFFSKSRTDTRVGAFNRYTIPTYGKIIENICNIKKIFDTLKLASFKILDHQKLQMSEISEVKNSKKKVFSQNHPIWFYKHIMSVKCSFSSFSSIRDSNEYDMRVEDFTIGKSGQRTNAGWLWKLRRK